MDTVIMLEVLCKLKHNKLMMLAGDSVQLNKQCEIRSAAVWKQDTLLEDTQLLFGCLFQSDSLPL